MPKGQDDSSAISSAVKAGNINISNGKIINCESIDSMNRWISLIFILCAFR